MNISINSKNLSVSLSKREIFVINTIIDKIDFISLKKIITNHINEDDLIGILKSLYLKKVVTIDNPSLLNIESFNSKPESLIYLYSNVSISEQIENICKKIKENNNYYSILSVSPKASLRDIKVAYFKLSKRYHPDIVGKYDLPDDIKKQVTFLIMELSNIFNVLKSESKRRKYNQTLDIFKTQVLKAKKVDVNEANISKGKEFSKLANDEYHNGDLQKALKLIKLSLSYNNKSEKALKTKTDIEFIINRDSISRQIRKVSQLIEDSEYSEAFEIINDLIMVHGDQERFLFKKVEILDNLNFSKNKNKIISILEDIVSNNRNNIKAREKLIESLSRSDEKALVKIHAKELLEIDSGNKIAKKYIKGKLWNIF